MMKTMQNVVAEWQYETGTVYGEPFHEIEIRAVVTDPEGRERTIPGFWGGGGVWKFRFSSPTVGRHRFRTVCSDRSNADLNGRDGEIEVVPYEGDNPLYRHGSPRAAPDRTRLVHADGTPFFWLGDTWWMSLTERLQWPDDARWLTQDRADKGFTVIQLVAGLYPDMGPFDPRGANEGGQAWEPEFARLNPAFFDSADDKIAHLVESGLMPCLVGLWGYYLDFAGADNIRRHWQYLIARYGAYPVAWCLAGEADMPYYEWDEFYDADKKKTYIDRMRKEWTKLARYVRENDPFGRMITIHPSRYGHDTVEDASLLDLDMLQTGHGSFASLEPTIRFVRTAVAHEPRTPVINSEVCYEGIGGTSFQEIQRYLFWSCMLNGACGHTYGANGLWQVNGTAIPYGPSPHGMAWGDTSWEEAAKLPGSGQVGLGKKLLERYEWWRFESGADWLDPKHADAEPLSRPYAAGIPDRVRIFYLPNGFSFSGIEVRGLERGAAYRAFLFDPITGQEHDYGQISPDADGKWKSGILRKFQDWVVVMERTEGE